MSNAIAEVVCGLALDVLAPVLIVMVIWVLWVTHEDGLEVDAVHDVDAPLTLLFSSGLGRVWMIDGDAAGVSLYVYSV